MASGSAALAARTSACSLASAACPNGIEEIDSITGMPSAIGMPRPYCSHHMGLSVFLLSAGCGFACRFHHEASNDLSYEAIRRRGSPNCLIILQTCTAKSLYFLG